MNQNDPKPNSNSDKDTGIGITSDDTGDKGHSNTGGHIDSSDSRDQSRAVPS
ncbi:hypothetical protein KC926_03000 [Candidatus Kaiserbacteria bacterium]|nr:hypothetical protein [Candidatus Kaiserbacteria bacterium]